MSTDNDPVVCGLEFAIRALGTIVLLLTLAMLAFTIGKVH